MTGITLEGKLKKNTNISFILFTCSCFALSVIPPMEKATCLLSPCCLLNAPLVSYSRLCPVSLRWALRCHLYLGELALHLCPLDLPGGFVICVGLLQLASPRLLLLQLRMKLLQQRPQGLQHLPVLPKLHNEDSDKTIIRERLMQHTQAHMNMASSVLVLMG